MKDDLIARLRDQHGMNGGQGAYAWIARELCGTAADRLAHLEAQVARLTKERDEAYERAAKVADAVESPFDEHSHAPENCAFYDAVEACAQAIRNLKEQP